VADLSRVLGLIPVRALEGAKARLGEALDAEERRALTERLLRRTVGAAAAARGVALVAVVSPDPAALAVAEESGAAALRQVTIGLNEALEEGRVWGRTMAATALLVLPADLPWIDTAAVAAILDAGRAAATAAPDRPLVAVVSDRSGTGTNALLVAPPGTIGFAFGPDSRAAHAAAAASAGATYVEVGGVLALDLDTPDDLLAAGDPAEPHAPGA
jgi:2-phospho-L-lactate guanylyltransferase